ncbi:MAG TPA: 3-deoxy-manno-octulosonate cytidylyltransferase [candidate division Zixibacteria bacterium]|nr:3-deoxy-manno-octulosonate cytidylyltransferase [candidate division Zixibacteria bacterium]
MKPKVLAVIPARFASKRFPGKPLSPIAGKPLIQHIYNAASKSKLIDRVVVATDSREIQEAVLNFGGEAVITSCNHRTGSDRAAEVMQKIGGEIIINIQADHIGVKPAVFDRVLKAILEDRKIRFATLARKVEDEASLFDPNRVKLILDADDYAYWFSRYPLPFLQGVNGDRLGQFDFYYHVGTYFFRKTGLKMFHAWPRSPLEKAESLEQLRILENNHKIKVFKIKSEILSIDTPQDLKLAEELYKK